MKRHIASSCVLVVVFLIASCATASKTVSLPNPREHGDLYASAVVGEYIVLLSEEGLATHSLSSLAAGEAATGSKAIDTYDVGSKNIRLLRKDKHLYFGGKTTLAWASVGDDGKLSDRGSIVLANGVTGLASEADRLYVLSRSALMVFKLGDRGFPESSEPESSQVFRGLSLGLKSRPGMLAATIYGYGVDFYDLTDPSSPSLVKSVKTEGFPAPSGLFYRDYYILSNLYLGFQAIDTRTFAPPSLFYRIPGVAASVYQGENSLYFASSNGRGVWKLDGAAIPASGEIPAKAVLKLPISSEKRYLSSTSAGIASLFHVSGKLYGLLYESHGTFFALDEKDFKTAKPELLESSAPGLKSKKEAAILIVAEGFTVGSLNGDPVNIGISSGDDRVYRIVYVPEGKLSISYTYSSTYFKSKGTQKASVAVLKGRTYILHTTSSLGNLSAELAATDRDSGRLRQVANFPPM